MKYLINSIPKSGTYLTANIFKNLGIADSGIHIQNSVKSIYAADGWRKSNNQKYVKGIYRNSEDIIDEVKDGEFLTGHIEKTELMTKKFSGYKKVLLVRDMPGIIESSIRYKEETGADFTKSANFKKIILEIKEWKTDKDFLVINFNDLIEKNIEVIDSLQKHLFGEVRFDSLEIIELSLKQDSPTKSNLRKNVSHEE
jgi:hypothetical protein